MPEYKLFTSESVTEGHPDKLCDQISDAVLDAILQQDPAARVACECAATRGAVMVMGEITTECYADIPSIARGVIEDVGYTDSQIGFDANTCAIFTAIDSQSPDIALGVNRALDSGRDLDIGAGDQGMMFGYACDENAEHMPQALVLAHRLCRNLAAVRKAGTLPYLRPDGKAQVTLAYLPDGQLSHIHTVVLSTQHTAQVSIDQLRGDVLKQVILPCLPSELLRDDTRYLINPTGRFVSGGPMADCGLTGRKIIVDTYGGFAHHGGGAFSGKDPTKVDRSAAYAARHVARNLVAAGLAKRCEVSLAYAIGVAHPVQISVNSFGTGKVDDAVLADAVNRVFDLRPAAIIERLGLRRPIYRQTAAYGHFGRSDLDLPWERLDAVAALQAAL